MIALGPPPSSNSPTTTNTTSPPPCFPPRIVVHADSSTQAAFDAYHEAARLRKNLYSFSYPARMAFGRDGKEMVVILPIPIWTVDQLHECFVNQSGDVQRNPGGRRM